MSWGRKEAVAVELEAASLISRSRAGQGWEGCASESRGERAMGGSIGRQRGARAAAVGLQGDKG